MAYSYWRCSASTICSGGTAIASGSNGSYPVSNAFDGNYSSYWWANTTGAGSWLGYHFATQKKIAAFYFESAFTGYYANGYVFEYSNDGTNWTSLDLVVSPSGVWSYGYNYVVNPVLASYYRLRCLGVSTSTNAWCVNEVLMFEAVEKYNISENLCSGGTVISGGDYSTTYAKEKAFDLSVSTKWYSSQSGTGISGVAYIGYQFTSAVKPDLVLACGLADDDEEPTSIKLQNSDDGTTWNDVATYARNTDWNYGMYPINGSSTYLSPANGAYICLVVPSTATAAAYWRLIANANLASGKYWFLYELAFANIIPIVTINSYDKSIISDESGYDVCNVSFTVDQYIYAWEARAGGEGLGQGLLVGSSTVVGEENLIPANYTDFDSSIENEVSISNATATWYATGGYNNSAYLNIVESSVDYGLEMTLFQDSPLREYFDIVNGARIFLKYRGNAAVTFLVTIIDAMDEENFTQGTLNSVGTGNWETLVTDISFNNSMNYLVILIERQEDNVDRSYDLDSLIMYRITNNCCQELLTENQQGVETDLTGFDDFSGMGYGANLCTGGSVISGGDFNEYVKENAYDGDTQTFWVSSQMTTQISGNAYIGYHFATTKTLKKISLYTLFGLTSIIVQGSNNGTSWNTVQQFDSLSTDPGWQDLIFSNSTGYSYWRLLANANNEYFWAVAEITMHEEGVISSIVTRDTTIHYEGSASVKGECNGAGIVLNGGSVSTGITDIASEVFYVLDFMCYSSVGMQNIFCDIYDVNNSANHILVNGYVVEANTWERVSMLIYSLSGIDDILLHIYPSSVCNINLDSIHFKKHGIPASTPIEFDIENEELTQGDLQYRITVYAQGRDGGWSGY
jgi:hypothetical protein